MAVNVGTLREALRGGSSPEETAIYARLIQLGAMLVEKHAPEAPDEVRDEACIRVSAYLYDQPNAGRGTSFADAWTNSGARQLVEPWRVHRAGELA